MGVHKQLSLGLGIPQQLDYCNVLVTLDGEDAHRGYRLGHRVREASQSTVLSVRYLDVGAAVP